LVILFLNRSSQDPRMLKVLYTNLRWSFSMRGEPGDCLFLKPAMPVTGRKLRPHTNPFQEESYYSVAEERALALEGIARLPDRTGPVIYGTKHIRPKPSKSRPVNSPSRREGR